MRIVNYSGLHKMGFLGVYTCQGRSEGNRPLVFSPFRYSARKAPPIRGLWDSFTGFLLTTANILCPVIMRPISEWLNEVIQYSYRARIHDLSMVDAAVARTLLFQISRLLFNREGLNLRPA